MKEANVASARFLPPRDVEFDEDECLCQMKVIPEDKRIDFIVLRDDPKTGKRSWKPVLRFHKDCSIHGIKVTECQED